MSPQKPLILDFAKTDAMKVILLHPAILSSHGANWQGIHVEYHCQPPNKCAEHCLEQHTIGLMLNSATLK